MERVRIEVTYFTIKTSLISQCNTYGVSQGVFDILLVRGVCVHREGLGTYWEVMQTCLYSVSPSPGSDVSMQMQLASTCTHSLFLHAYKPLCAIPLAAHDLELRLANKRATSQPGDGETEYSCFSFRRLSISCH